MLINFDPLWAWQNLSGHGRIILGKFGPWGMLQDPSYDNFCVLCWPSFSEYSIFWCMWGYMKVYKAIWRYMKVHEGIWRYIRMYVSRSRSEGCGNGRGSNGIPSYALIYMKILNIRTMRANIRPKNGHNSGPRVPPMARIWHAPSYHIPRGFAMPKGGRN